MKIIKVNREHTLNEDGLSAGYNMQGGYNTSGFSYSILPLQFNLGQKGNDMQPSIENKSFKFFVGEMVKGFSPYDNKKHQGIIKYLYYTVEDQETPKLVYVHDMDINNIIPLTPDSLKHITAPFPNSNVGNNYLGSGASHVGYDLENYTQPIKESKTIDFNKLISWNDNEIKFDQSTIDSSALYQKVLYDFDKCEIGDLLYEDNAYGVNTKAGKEVARCCIQAGDIDDHAHFVSLEQPEEKEYKILIIDPSTYESYGINAGKANKDMYLSQHNILKSTIARKWVVDYDGEEVVAEWKNNETNGWNNTEAMRQYGSQAVEVIKNIDNHCYIPSALELFTAMKLGDEILDGEIEILSSTQVHSISPEDNNIDDLQDEPIDTYGIHIVSPSKNTDPLVTMAYLGSSCWVKAFYNPYVDNNKKSLRESFDFNSALLSAPEDEIFFSTDNRPNQKIKSSVNSVILDNFIKEYVKKSTIFNRNSEIVEIDENTRCLSSILTNGKLSDPVHTKFQISIVNNKLDIAFKNGVLNDFNNNEKIDVVNLFNTMLFDKGIEFNTLRIRDISMNLRYCPRIKFAYEDLIKYKQFPKHIVIENPIRSQDWNVDDFVFTITSKSDNKTFFDINECLKIKQAFENAGIKHVVFDQKYINEIDYVKLYCSDTTIKLKDFNELYNEVLNNYGQVRFIFSMDPEDADKLMEKIDKNISSDYIRLLPLGNQKKSREMYYCLMVIAFLYFHLHIPIFKDFNKEVRNYTMNGYYPNDENLYSYIKQCMVNIYGGFLVDDEHRERVYFLTQQMINTISHLKG